MFYLNISICGITISNAILEGWVQVTNMLQPTRIVPTHTYLAQISLALLVPCICDAVLIVRLLALFPKTLTTKATYVKLLAFPVFCKAARISILIAYLVATKAKVKDLKGSVLLVGEVTWFRNPYITSEWILQVLDNS